MTSSPSLRKALGAEVNNLNTNAKDVGEATWKEESRRVSWIAWLLIKVGVEGYL
jgi:CDP-diacylglycerol--glycerol-3-phosphate 3-phosphatidyltransferase